MTGKTSAPHPRADIAQTWHPQRLDDATHSSPTNSLFEQHDSLHALIKFPVWNHREFCCKPLILGGEFAVAFGKSRRNREIPCIFPC
jgi:hypothetical protein